MLPSFFLFASWFNTQELAIARELQGGVVDWRTSEGAYRRYEARAERASELGSLVNEVYAPSYVNGTASGRGCCNKVSGQSILKNKLDKLMVKILIIEVYYDRGIL